MYFPMLCGMINITLFGVLILLGCVEGRIHTATIKNDARNHIALSSFGYVKGASLLVNVTVLKFEGKSAAKKSLDKIGFTLDKSSNTGTSAYVEENSLCDFPLSNKKKGEDESEANDVPQAFFSFKQDKNKTVLEIHTHLMGTLKFYSCEEEWQNAHTTEKNATTKKPPVTAKSTKSTSSTKDLETKKAKKPTKKRSRRDTAEKDDGLILSKILPVSVEKMKKGSSYSTSFYMGVSTDEEAGFYELFFHNCYNHKPLSGYSNKESVPVTMIIKMTEMNQDNYLSAGDMALPSMYGSMSLLFLVSGIYWFFMLCTTKNQVFKIHYLMGTLMVIKSMSVMFHAEWSNEVVSIWDLAELSVQLTFSRVTLITIDYYFIGRDGRPEAWAVIFYIVHLLKGMLLFICLLLIGTGWAFIKYILSDREKKVFLIVIPLQVIANVAYIITEGTDEDSKLYSTWRDVMILVDLLCCGAILVPVIWSVRHLQEASHTDGKAAINLAKLKLFQQFYVMVICYLYFTRIIVYLLEITLPFQWIWMDKLFTEVGTYIFFVITGYKFRPGCNNPYLSVPQDDDDDSSHAITESGLTETVTKVNQYDKNFDVSDEEEEDLLLPLQRHRSSFV